MYINTPGVGERTEALLLPAGRPQVGIYMIDRVFSAAGVR